MDQLLQHLANALILGGTYALLGIGLTLIFGIMRVVNFAHGELYSFGAYMMYLWVMVLGANFYLALPLAVLLGIALGALIELVLLDHRGVTNLQHVALDAVRGAADFEPLPPSFPAPYLEITGGFYFNVIPGEAP